MTSTDRKTESPDVAQAAPEPASAAWVEALDDVKTHRSAWRGAIAGKCEPFGSDDDGSYWDHELQAFDRTFAALAKPPQPASPAYTWRDISTAPKNIREFAALRARNIPWGPVVQFGGSIADGSIFLFGHDALTHEVKKWIVIPQLLADSPSLPSTDRKTESPDVAQTLQGSVPQSSSGSDAPPRR